MPKHPDLTSELTLATTLAQRAGAAIIAVRAEAIASSSLKADDSPVTKADLAADAIIRAGLVDTGDRVVTEETWAGGERAVGRLWFVDPLDGTEDFVAGRKDYVVQIGLCIDGVPALGVLFQPETGVTWRGVVAEGRCERIDASGAVVARTVSSRAVAAVPRVAISVSHPSAVVDYIVGELGVSAVRLGSVGLKVGAIVDDEADAYVSASSRIKVWDTCAPAAVLLAAGGVCTTLDGGALRYDLEGGAAHVGGVCMWTPAAQRALATKVETTVRRFRDTSTSG